MDLRNPETLNRFGYLCGQSPELEELDLLHFLRTNYDAYQNNGNITPEYTVSENLRLLKQLIKGIESPDKIIIHNATVHWFKLDFFTGGNYISDNSAGLIENVDFVKKTYLSKYFQYFRKFDSNEPDSFKLFEEQETSNHAYKFSWNGIKKLRDYMITISMTNLTNIRYPGTGGDNRCYIDKLDYALDFEKVYKKAKEIHAYNRKNYLEALQSVSARAEINDIAPKTDLTKRSKKHIRYKKQFNADTVDLIILNLKNGTRKYIVSQDITERLNEIIESFDYDFTISFAKIVDPDSTDDITVIKSINKKDLVSYLT